MAYGTLASKGRYGDTEIRNVAGRKSHVNRQEARAIDLYGKLGERLVQEVGSGAINPATGLPEYDWQFSAEHTYKHARGEDYAHPETNEDRIKNMYETLPYRFDEEEYFNQIKLGQGNQYLRSLGVPENDLQFFQSDINMDLLEGEGGGFLKRGRDISKGSAMDRYNLGMEQASLATGSKFGDVTTQTSRVVGESGLESSGSNAFASEKAKKGVFQDYTLQQKQLASTKAAALETIDLDYETSMGDIKKDFGSEFFQNWENVYENM